MGTHLQSLKSNLQIMSHEDQLDRLIKIKAKLKLNTECQLKYVKKLIKNIDDYDVEVMSESKIGKVIRKLSLEDHEEVSKLAKKYIDLVKAKLPKENAGSYSKVQNLVKREVKAESSNIDTPKIKSKAKKHKIKEETTTSSTSPKKKIKLESDNNDSSAKKKTKKKKKSSRKIK